ncbi:Uncharacterised protein [Burkholderia gladioli]|nr:Uncharacterised protein [Burkholderia gladioli]
MIEITIGAERADRAAIVHLRRLQRRVETVAAPVAQHPDIGGQNRLGRLVDVRAGRHRRLVAGHQGGQAAVDGAAILGEHVGNGLPRHIDGHQCDVVQRRRQFVQAELEALRRALRDGADRPPVHVLVAEHLLGAIGRDIGLGRLVQRERGAGGPLRTRTELLVALLRQVALDHDRPRHRGESRREIRIKLEIAIAAVVDEDAIGVRRLLHAGLGTAAGAVAGACLRRAALRPRDNRAAVVPAASRQDRSRRQRRHRGKPPTPCGGVIEHARFSPCCEFASALSWPRDR